MTKLEKIIALGDFLKKLKITVPQTLRCLVEFQKLNIPFEEVGEYLEFLVDEETKVPVPVEKPASWNRIHWMENGNGTNGNGHSREPVKHERTASATATLLQRLEHLVGERLVGKYYGEQCVAWVRKDGVHLEYDDSVHLSLGAAVDHWKLKKFQAVNRTSGWVFFGVEKAEE